MDETPSKTTGARAGVPRHRPELVHQPALDGLRGVAVLGVLLFHAGVSWAGGGWLGVEIFFVLSGYLITSLLLAEWQGSGQVVLAGFWARRARRLLPALFVLVIACALYEAIVGPARAVPGFSADGLSTLFYVANWHQVWTGAGYFVATGVVSPLQHTWSLAIEEQFYVIWPLLVIGALGLGRRIGHGRRPAVALVPALVLAGLGAVASAGEMAWLYHGGSGLNRVYYGTDTRASGLLVGATVAIAMAIRQQSFRPAEVRPAPAGRLGPVLLGLGGLAGAAGVGLAVASAGPEPAWIFEGGMLGIDLATAAVILACVAATSVASPLRAVLSAPPLRATGLISYGLYLWHFPLFLWLTGPSTGLSATPLLWLRLGATFAVSLGSYVLVEQPIRQRRLPRLAVRTLGPVALAGSLAAVLVAGEVTTVAAVRPPVHLTVSRAGPSQGGDGTAVAGGSGASGASASSAASASSGNLRGPASSPTTTQPNWQGTAEPGCRYPIPAFHTDPLFHTCPPVKVLFVGDSIALTIGVESTIGEEHYGVRIGGGVLLGCSFMTAGESDELGQGYGRPSPPCLSELSTWRQDLRTFNPQAVVVEMGYWDEMNWLWGSADYVHLGVPSFDAALRQRVAQVVQELSAGGRPVVLLTVPWVDPGPWPNGEVEPQATAVRHQLINQVLASVAAAHPGSVHVFDVSPYVTPSGQYQSEVGGEICRASDGIHLFIGPVSGPYSQTVCGADLQAALLPFVRRLVSAHNSSSVG
jgi:peptidoglycan/LPS O-acetylase OafA/YrhL